MASAPVSSARSRQDAWWLGLLIALPLLAYARLATAGFVWDDDTLLTANPLVQTADGLRRIWFTTQAIDYWPVTYSSFWVEWRIWGPWAPGYHLTNLLLHIAETILLWRLLRRLALPGAAWAALWFALHPLNVESVAWIAQRKNLLAMLFYLLSIWWFVPWVERVVPNALVRPLTSPSALGTTRSTYCLSLLSFILALLSKGSVATLPLVLLGLIGWHRRPTRNDVLRLAPFFLAAAILAVVNIWFTHKTGATSIREIGWPARIAGAGTALWFYLGRIFWPAHLSFVYPQWTVHPSDPLWWLGAALAVFLTISLWLGRSRGTKPELAAWLYFGVMLLPGLGLIDVYFMRFSLVADHYAHLALVGMAAWGAARFTLAKGPPGLAWVLALALGLLTFRQTAIYHDNVTLFRSVLAHDPNSWMAHENLGNAWLKRPGHSADAIAELREALRLKSDYPEAHNDLGTVWWKTPGRLPDAISEYEEALRLKPDYAEAHNNLGNAWSGIPGRLGDAIAQYEEALRLSPDFAEAHNNLGCALANEPGRIQEAIGQFQEATRIKPDFTEAQDNLRRARELAGEANPANPALRHGK